MRTIAFFIPARAPFYQYPLSHLANCFKIMGYQTLRPISLTSQEELDCFILKHKPNIIFDINRFKTDWSLKKLERITYISWIIDTWGRRISSLGASDIVYFFLKDWLDAYQHPAYVRKGYLIPGTLPPITLPAAQNKYDWFFAGHMPKPWTKKELKRKVKLDNQRFISFQDVVNLAEHHEKTYQYFWTDEQFLLYLKMILANNFNANIAQGITGALRYDLGHRINRLSRRYMFIKKAIRISDRYCLAGSDGWRHWPEFSKKYAGYIHPAEIRSYNRASKLVLHEGPGIHFRLLDAMSDGIPVIVNDLQGRDGSSALLNFFNDGQNIILSSLEELAEKGKYYLSHSAVSARISRNASMKIKKYHLWKHRAQQIISDLNKL